MTRDAYERTVRDLLHLEEDVASGLAPDAFSDESGFSEAGAVGEVDAQRLADTADAVARAAVARGLPALLSCSPDGANETSCIDTFVRSIVRAACL